MPLIPALQVLADVRRDQIVVTTMGSAREWPKLSQHALDFQYLPSAMGHAPALGLGLAMAQPEREVIVINGDGGMLMSLGVLVTIAAAQATNFTLTVLDNRLYEVTGGQATASHAANVDFAAMARASGFANAWGFDSLETWRREAAACLSAKGPRFISLKVEPVGDAYALPAATSIVERANALRRALAKTGS
jgi:thiamine pyrophosphate-dependent acetolactate synthase large subunit-like protein